MINPYIHINRVFREQVQKGLGCYLSTKTMKAIIYFLLNKNSYVMALIMIYENSGKGIRKVYRMLGCVVYTLIDNYVCIYYLSCQPKTLCGISKNPTFKEKTFQFITRYWHSRPVTEPSILSWINDEIEFNCGIKCFITYD